MRTPIVNLTVRLEVAFRQEGACWLAWCLPLDVMTQAETKEKALESLKEAVGLWFESCIQRGVLDAALIEVGFHPAKLGEHRPKDGNIVDANRPRRPDFSAFEDFEVVIPAFIAAKQLGPSATC